MTLLPGTKIGRYEIRAKIGAGGMGEVYSAFDTDLDRTVAIKILPPALASNQQRLQRFTQEGQMGQWLLSLADVRVPTSVGHFCDQ